MKWKPSSLAGRVVVSVWFAALSSGSIVAWVTGSLSDRFARAQEDRHLRGAAIMLAHELRDMHLDPVLAALEESGKQAHAGISIAVFDREKFVTGERAIGYVGPEQCQDHADLRVCSVAAGRWVASAARDRELTTEHLETTTRLATAAVMITSLLSSFVALLLVRRALAPIGRLARSVQSVPENQPEAAQLGPDEGVREVDALRASLQHAFDRLGHSLTQARGFSANAAHQLRTPLTTIIGELELALEVVHGAGRDEVARAHKVAGRFSVLLERLLILARPDEVLQMMVEPWLLDLVEDALDALPEPLRQRITYSGAPMQIRADPALVVSAITNGLDNALKYSSGEVRVSTEDHGAHVTLAIEDDGPGVSRSERERVFDPFYRGHPGNSSAQPGHGIGLAVIARVASLHGGSARFVDRHAGARLEMVFVKAVDALSVELR
jgi:signal transduction histidine kinase